MLVSKQSSGWLLRANQVSELCPGRLSLAGSCRTAAGCHALRYQRCENVENVLLQTKVMATNINNVDLQSCTQQVQVCYDGLKRSQALNEIKLHSSSSGSQPTSNNMAACVCLVTKEFSLRCLKQQSTKSLHRSPQAKEQEQHSITMLCAAVPPCLLLPLCPAGFRSRKPPTASYCMQQATTNTTNNHLCENKCTRG